MNDFIIQTNEPLPSPKLRSSERTQRSRILVEIEDLTAKLCDSNEKWEASGDGLHLRQRNQYRSQLDRASAALEKFDAGISKGHEAAESPEAETARRAFEKRLQAWEKLLIKFSTESAALMAAADTYAAASGVKDAGRFPHKHIIKSGISRRAHGVLTGYGLHFDKHSPAYTESLVSKWVK